MSKQILPFPSLILVRNSAAFFKAGQGISLAELYIGWDEIPEIVLFPSSHYTTVIQLSNRSEITTVIQFFITIKGL